MPLIAPENQIWALLDGRKSQSCGKGFPSGASVPILQVQPHEQVASSGFAAVSKDCLGTFLHPMGSRGWHHVGIRGEIKPISFCHG